MNGSLRFHEYALEDHHISLLLDQCKHIYDWLSSNSYHVVLGV